jgi:hypothetical protein
MLVGLSLREREDAGRAFLKHHVAGQVSGAIGRLLVRKLERDGGER